MTQGNNFRIPTQPPHQLISAFAGRSVTSVAVPFQSSGEGAVELDGIVMPRSEQFSSDASKSPHTLHQYYCNSLALGYLAAAVPHWQIPIRDAVPFTAARAALIFPFLSSSLGQFISYLLNMKHFNFCAQSKRFPHFLSLCATSPFLSLFFFFFLTSL